LTQCNNYNINNYYYNYSWSGVVVDALASINEVNLRQSINESILEWPKWHCHCKVHCRCKCQ